MFHSSVQHFCDRVLDQRAIRSSDVQDLLRNVLPDGIVSQEQADLLLALDRAVTATTDAFADALVALVVDFAVWGERPTGRVDAATARWLVGSLRGAHGPSPTGARVAFEVVRAAQHVDEALVVFALEANGRGRAATFAETIAAAA